GESSGPYYHTGAAALTCLDNESADPELARLARDCLAREAQDRPPDAGHVAKRIAQHREGVQQRTRAAELASAAANARANLTIWLAASILLIIGLVAGGVIWQLYQQQER